MADFFIFLRGEGPDSPAVEGYQAAPNMVSALRGQKLLIIWELSLFSRVLKEQANLEGLNHWHEMLLVLQSLIRLPDELMKLSSDKHLTLNSSFLLAMALATRVSEFHSSMGSITPVAGPPVCSPSCCFVFKTENPAVQATHFESSLSFLSSTLLLAIERRCFSALSEL